MSKRRLNIKKLPQAVINTAGAVYDVTVDTAASLFSDERELSDLIEIADAKVLEMSAAEVVPFVTDVVTVFDPECKEGVIARSKEIVSPEDLLSFIKYVVKVTRDPEAREFLRIVLLGSRQAYGTLKVVINGLKSRLTAAHRVMSKSGEISIKPLMPDDFKTKEELLQIKQDALFAMRLFGVTPLGLIKLIILFRDVQIDDLVRSQYVQ